MTEQDIDAKLDRLCAKYREAAASVILLQPQSPPTRRRQRRLEERVVDIMGTFQRFRKPQSGGLVRLAYVRGMRSVVSDARLEEEGQLEVARREHALDYELRKIESGQIRDYRNRMRRLYLANHMRQIDVPEEFVDAVEPNWRIYPLEQRARASVQVAVEDAYAAGALAARKSQGYDNAA